MVLAMIVFKRSVGCADSPGSSGGEERVGARESGSHVVEVVVQRNQFRMYIV